MKSFLQRYVARKKFNTIVALDRMKHQKTAYLFLLPFAVLFITFFILPMITSIYYSFTYYNILEPPRFIGLSNYINLLLQDRIFLIAAKNTFIIALITGPIGYLLSFMFAWFINELPKWLRTIAIVIFYAPTIAGNAYFIFGIIFRGDIYGYLNALLVRFSIITEPVLWLTNPDYMMAVIVLVLLWMSMGAGFLAFVAGLKGVDPAQYEAGYVDGVRNRWQELYYITLPSMRPMLLFGAVMSITAAFSVADQTMALCGYPSTDYAARTVVTHLFDYGYTRFDMGYASAIATILFLVMILCNNLIQRMLRRLGK